MIGSQPSQVSAEAEDEIEETVRLVDQSTEIQFMQEDMEAGNQMGVFGADQLQFENVLRRIHEKFRAYL